MDTPGAAKKSPWPYIALGCLGLLIVAGVVVAVSGYFLVSKVDQMGKEMNDPEIRDAKARKLLGADTLPEGYRAVAALSVPYVMDMAALSKGADTASAGPDRTGLMYMRVLSDASNKAELRKYMDGEDYDADALQNLQVSVEETEVIRRGRVQTEDATYLYVANRGPLRAQTHNTDSDSINSVMLVDCDMSAKLHLMLWFAPDPGPGKPIDEVDLSGTPADEAALKQLVSHFAPCSVK